MAGVWLTLLLAGCHKSGVWQNEPGVWEKAFGRKPAEGTVVVRSWYWRSWHPRSDQEYFFELEPNPNFKQQALGSGLFLDATPANPQEVAQVLHFLNEKPRWFLPKPIESYEVFRGKPPQENFRLFIDRDSGALFVTDFAKTK